MKQFFDISTLIDEHTDFSCVRSTYYSTSNAEIGYRGISGTPDDALMDTIRSALCIGTRGKTSEEDFPNYLEGSRRVRDHIFASGFSMEQAAKMAPKIIYMAACLLTDTPFNRIDDPAQFRDEKISYDEFLPLKNLKKANALGYAYLINADRLLGKYTE